MNLQDLRELLDSLPRKISRVQGPSGLREIQRNLQSLATSPHAAHAKSHAKGIFHKMVRTVRETLEEVRPLTRSAEYTRNSQKGSPMNARTISPVAALFALLAFSANAAPLPPPAISPELYIEFQGYFGDVCSVTSPFASPHRKTPYDLYLEENLEQMKYVDSPARTAGDEFGAILLMVGDYQFGKIYYDHFEETWNFRNVPTLNMHTISVLGYKDLEYLKQYVLSTNFEQRYHSGYKQWEARYNAYMSSDNSLRFIGNADPNNVTSVIVMKAGQEVAQIEYRTQDGRYHFVPNNRREYDFRTVFSDLEVLKQEVQYFHWRSMACSQQHDYLHNPFEHLQETDLGIDIDPYFHRKSPGSHGTPVLPRISERSSSGITVIPIIQRRKSTHEKICHISNICHCCPVRTA